MNWHDSNGPDLKKKLFARFISQNMIKKARIEKTIFTTLQIWCLPMWWSYSIGPSGFSGASTAEVTTGVNGRGPVAVITGTQSICPLFLTSESLHSVCIYTQTRLGAVCSNSELTLVCLWIGAGASSGIGLETARVLALRGVHVVMAVRNVSAGFTAKEEILGKVPGAKVDVLELDLSSMASVGTFASKFESLNLPLNVLM
jgi:WW domain-containing oxidoreductase